VKNHIVLLVFAFRRKFWSKNLAFGATAQNNGIFLFLIIKLTTCNNFSNLFLEWNSTCFGQFFCPSSGVFHCTHSNGICHTGLLTACEQAVNKPVWHIPLLCVQWKTPDDGQRNCPKHVEFHSKNKFEKLLHLVGSILRNLTTCTATWKSKTEYSSKKIGLYIQKFCNKLYFNNCGEVSMSKPTSSSPYILKVCCIVTTVLPQTT